MQEGIVDLVSISITSVHCYTEGGPAVPTNLQARFPTVEQQHTTEKLGLCPIPYHTQQAEWVSFEFFVVCVVEVDVELIVLVGKVIIFH